VFLEKALSRITVHAQKFFREILVAIAGFADEPTFAPSREHESEKDFVDRKRSRSLGSILEITTSA